MTKAKALDKLYIGLIIGMLVPLVTFWLYYLLKFREVEFITDIRNIHLYKILFKILSLCVLPDLGVFYLFINNKYYHAAKGVVMACFIYALTVLAYRIIG